jgi:lipopolysaccharide assembly protein A
MRYLTWAIRIAVFFLLVAFAAKNVEPVTLRFYFDLMLETPLVLALFGFFVAGALFGMLALLGTLVRQRREIGLLKKNKSMDATVPPPI